MNIPPPAADFAAALAWLVGTAAALTALAVIGRVVRRMWRRARKGWRWSMITLRNIEALHVIIEREMTANGGSSMKDKIDEQCAAGHRRDAQFQQYAENNDAVQAEILMEQARQREKLDDVWYRIAGLR